MAEPPNYQIEVFPNVFIWSYATVEKDGVTYHLFDVSDQDAALDEAGVACPADAERVSPRYARGMISCSYVESNDINVHFYSAEKHNFSEWAAVQEAAEVNKTKIFMENLS